MYFVLRFADRVGYKAAIKRLTGKPLRDLRRKIVWFGGWESPELSQWDRGVPAWDIFARDHRSEKPRRRITNPFPLTILSVLTCYGWGWNLRLGRGYLVYSSYETGRRRCYWSPNGTPQHPGTVMIWQREMAPKERRS